MPVDRNMSDEFVAAFRNSGFGALLRQDRQLVPAVRPGSSFSIYYRSAAVVRDLRARDGQLVGKIHQKYIPIDESGSAYRHCAFEETGSTFQSGNPISFDPNSSDVVQAYKDAIVEAERGNESAVVQAIIESNSGGLLDVELAFAVSGEITRDKIDLVHFDRTVGAVSFVEVKEAGDRRLYSKGGKPPEVLTQLQRYRGRIADNSGGLISAYKGVAEAFGKLEIGECIGDLSSSEINAIVARPGLVIGGLDEAELDAIRNQSADSPFTSLVDQIRNEDLASAVIICGHNGCQLSLDEQRDDGSVAIMLSRDVVSA